MPKALPKQFPFTIGSYSFVRQISKGGMACVYEAKRESFAGVSARVAIKMILPEKADNDVYKNLFVTEAKISSTLMHKNIVHVQDFEEADGLFMLVMEYIEGYTLRDMMRYSHQHGIPIPVHVIAEIGRQLCEGLHHAHQARAHDGRPLGLVHCDIKPGNVIVNNEGAVKILDFGVSQAILINPDINSTRGTWGYMSVEQAEQQHLTPRTDLFSLAIVLYEMAASKGMFTKVEQSDITLMKQYLREDMVGQKISKLSGNYETLREILLCAAQRDPNARYATAQEMADALSVLIPDPVIAQTDLSILLRKIQSLRKNGERTEIVSPRIENNSDFSGVPVDAVPIKNQERKQNFALLFLLLVPLCMVMLLFFVKQCVYAPVDTEPKTEIVEEPPVVEPVEPVVPDPSTEMQVIEENPGDGNFEKPTSKKPKKSKIVEEVDPRITPKKEPKEEEPVVVQQQPANKGSITISADESATVFIAGKKLDTFPVIKYQLAPGEYRIHLANKDGKVKVFTLNMHAGEDLLYQWSFAENRWLREGSSK